MTVVKKFKSAGFALTILGTLGVSTVTAQACKEIIALSYIGSDEGELSIHINDVVFVKGSSRNSFGVALPDLLLEGENSLTVELIASEGSPAARAEVFQACEGVFPGAPGENPNVLAEISLSAPWSETVHFIVEGLPNYTYLSAEPSDDKGLLEAVGEMQRAAREGNVEGYVAYLQPMLADMSLIGGPPVELVYSMVADLLGGDYEVANPAELAVTPVIGGRAYQVQSASGDGPLVFRATGGEGINKISQASIWIKTADGWKVLRQ